MDLPNNVNVIVVPERFYNYLLDKEHPIVKKRAEFFLRLGIDLDNLGNVFEQIKQIPLKHETSNMSVIYKVGLIYKFNFTSIIKFPNNSFEMIKTYWISKPKENIIEFLTATILR